jgi:hypothetical protein
VGLVVSGARADRVGHAAGRRIAGGGGFEAAFLVITGLVVVPGILVANCWLFFVRWPGRGTLLLAGLLLPGLMGLAQALLFFGPHRLLDPINQALAQTPWLLWAALGFFFVPLAAMGLRSAAGRLRAR